MKKIFLILIISLFQSHSKLKAYYPDMILKFKNVKITRSQKELLKQEILDFLAQSPEALKPDGKRYKVDQFCKYRIETITQIAENSEHNLNAADSTELLLLDTLEVLDQKKNLAYNLKIIEFLREKKALNITKKKNNEPIEISFKYLAF